MKVHIARDRAIPVGGAKWLELNAELVFLFSDQSITTEGARALEGCWQAYIDRGVWQWQIEGGLRPTVEYLIAVLPRGVAAAVSSSRGRVRGLLSPDHFHPVLAEAIERVAGEVADRGWSYVAHPAVVP